MRQTHDVDDLQRIAEQLAARLGRAVAIDDPQMHLLAHTPHREPIDDSRVESIMRLAPPKDIIDHVLSMGIAHATEPVRIAHMPERGLLARVCVPVRCQSVLLGYLWLIDADGSLSRDDLVASQEAADSAGHVLFRQQLLGDLRNSRERELLRDLLSEDQTLHESAAEALAEEEIVARVCTTTALAVSVADDHVEAARSSMDVVLRDAARRTSPSTGLALARGNGRGVLLLCGRRPPESALLRRTADELRDSLLQALGIPNGVVVGIGPTVPMLEDAVLSARRAWEAVAVAGAIRSLGEIVPWEDLGVYKLLARLPHQDIKDTLPDGLVRLIETDRSGVLVETLETWLDEGGNPRETIARLSIHRTSLYYRIGRIEEITGMRLSNGQDRLALHLGLKVATLLGRQRTRS